MQGNLITLFPHMFVFIIGMLCTVCLGDPKLDTSSDVAFSESLKKMIDSIPETELAVFQANLSTVLTGKMTSVKEKEQPLERVSI